MVVENNHQASIRNLEVQVEQMAKQLADQQENQFNQHSSESQGTLQIYHYQTRYCDRQGDWRQSRQRK